MALSGLTVGCALQGCFTGVEYTPSIKYKPEARGEGTLGGANALDSLMLPEAPAQWRKGKPFLVVDNRASLALRAEDNPGREGMGLRASMLAAGDTLLYQGLAQAPDLVGEAETRLVLSRASDGASWSMRLPSGEGTLGDEPLQIPFLIDLDTSRNLDMALRGRQMWVLTSLWRDPSTGQRLHGDKGRKFVPVTLAEVRPGPSEDTPVMVVFSDAAGTRAAVLAAAPKGGVAPSTGALGSLLSESDPRLLYPRITPRHWQAIQEGRPMIGMTADEVTLCLGRPRTIDRGHDQSSAYERRVYADGRTLLFQDGLLEKMLY